MSSDVKKWMEGLSNNDTTCISVMSLGDLRFLIHVETEPLQQEELLDELEIVIKKRYEGRTLPFEGPAIEKWAILRFATLKAATPLSTEEVQVIATALTNGKKYVGQRTRTHEELKIKMTDPWSD